MTERTMPVSKARVHLGEVLARVREKDERVILEKNGIPVAAIVSLGDLEDWLEASDSEIIARMEVAKKEFLAGKFIPAEKVIAEIHKKFPLRKRRA